jgi:hypothetical protein
VSDDVAGGYAETLSCIGPSRYYDGIKSIGMRRNASLAWFLDWLLLMYPRDTLRASCLVSIPADAPRLAVGTKENLADAGSLALYAVR